jgi:hypothetical protein
MRNPDSAGVDIDAARGKGKNRRISIGTASTATPIGPIHDGSVTILPSVKCWVAVGGANVVSVEPVLDGALGDPGLPAGGLYRVSVPSGQYVALVAAEPGEAEVTVGA